MSVDDLAPKNWPEKVATGLEDWRQGLVFRTTGPLVWLTQGGGMDPVTGYEAGGELGAWRAALATDTDIQYLAVTSQTCDIAATGPGKRHPTVQVSPVRRVDEVFPADKVAAIRRHEVVEYVMLTSPPAEGDWAVDLRMSMPLSKGALVDFEPIPGFASETDEFDFSERVAQKARRPAVHDELTSGTVLSLRGFLSGAKKHHSWSDDVEQIRLLVVRGDRLRPKQVRLFVITDAKFDNAMRRPLRDWWKGEQKRLRKIGIKLEALAFRDLSSMQVTEYRDSIWLDLPELSRGPFT